MTVNIEEHLTDILSGFSEYVWCFHNMQNSLGKHLGHDVVYEA